MILGATITGSLILNSVNLASITGSEASINALNLFTASAATTGSNVFKSNQTVTGSVDITGSLTVVGPITGTVTTASYVLNAVSASYALNATTASYALVTTSASFAANATSASYAANTTTSSFALIATSASYSNNSTSASYAANSDLLDGRDSLTFANTGSNAFVGTQNINGAVAITGSLTTTGAITAQTLNVQQVTSSIVYSSGSNIFGNSVSNTQSMTGSVGISGSLSVNGVSTLSGALSGTSATFSGTNANIQLGATAAIATSDNIRHIFAGIGAFIGQDANGEANIGNNIYYSTGFKRRVTGFASNVRFDSGNIYLQVAASAAADSAITWTNALTIASTGAATFSGFCYSAIGYSSCRYGDVTQYRRNQDRRVSKYR